MPVVDPGERVYVNADGDSRQTVTVAEGTVYYGTSSVTDASTNDGSLSAGDDLTIDQGHYFFSTSGASFSVDAAELEAGSESGTVTPYSADGSHQTFAGDLELAAGAGTSAAGDTSFLAGIMGNLIGSALTKTHNFIAGVIGAYTVDTSNASDLPSGAVLGILSDGSQGADGAVVAVLDGGDPSTATNATAAFKLMANTNSASTSVEYGVDLYDAGRDSTVYSGGGLPSKVTKAALRTTTEICLMVGTAAPTNGVTGADFAEKGSIHLNTSDGKLRTNTNTKASPTWTIVGTQS